MNYYRLSLTEYNGEQEYSYAYLLRANNQANANKEAKQFVSQWYNDPDAEWTDTNTIEFFGGEIGVCIGAVVQTTKREFTKELVEHFTIS